MRNVEPGARGDTCELVLNPNVHNACGYQPQSRESTFFISNFN